MPIISDHTKCPPGSHDFTFNAEDFGADAEIQKHDGPLLLCNGCPAVVFYCRRDENYHHAGINTRSCFLVQEAGQDVPVPVVLTRFAIDPADGKMCAGCRAPIAGTVAFAGWADVLTCRTCALHMATCTDRAWDHPPAILAGPA